MDLNDFKNLADSISSIATTSTVFIGGVWAYLRFVRNREAHPKIEFSVDVEFVQRQDGYWIVEAVALVDNKGLVRHNILKFNFSIRYLKAGDPVEPDTKFLVAMPHSVAKGTWLPDGWGDSFVEPGVKTRYSAIARIPVEATTVLIHGKFFYPDKDWHTADKLLAVPKMPNSGDSPHPQS